ncbi:MAG: SRPBCC family protein [Verrucomicrobiales bacterium]|nr:SRPBCC family protein [Verrucomicrobiales bacterium]
MSRSPFPVFSLITLVFLSAAMSDETSKPDHWIKTPAQWALLEAGDVIILESTGESETKGSNHAATAAILIDSPVIPVWDVVNDQEKAPNYMKTLRSSKLLEEHEGYSLIQQQVKIGFHKVNYVVKHVPTPPSVIHFSRERGDMKEMNGFWRFIEVGGGEESKTLLIYRLSLKPDFPVPAFLIRKSLSDNLPDTLTSVRDEVLRIRKDS